MPQKPHGKDKRKDITPPRSATTGPRAYPNATKPSESAMLAAPPHAAQTHPSRDRSSHLFLPPLSYLQAGSQFLPSTTSSSALATSYSGAGGHAALSQYNSPAHSYAFAAFGQTDNFSSLPIQRSENEFQSHLSPEPRGPSQNPLKRPYGASESIVERCVGYSKAIQAS